MEEDKQQDSFINDFWKFAEQMQALNTQVLAVYVPEVDFIIQSQSRDSKQIESILDGLLDFAGDRRILALYRKLCQYYYFINPQATADYIQFYKEIYDEEGGLFKSGYFKNNPVK